MDQVRTVPLIKSDPNNKSHPHKKHKKKIGHIKCSNLKIILEKHHGGKQFPNVLILNPTIKDYNHHTLNTIAIVDLSGHQFKPSPVPSSLPLSPFPLSLPKHTTKSKRTERQRNKRMVAFLRPILNSHKTPPYPISHPTLIIPFSKREHHFLHSPSYFRLYS